MAAHPFQITRNNSDDADSTTRFQLQQLAARYGVVGSYAALIAALAWGGGHHG